MNRRLLGLAIALLAGQLAFHAYDLSSPGLMDRASRLKLPDFLQFYTYGTLVREGDAGQIYDPAAHARIATRVDSRLHLIQFQPNYNPAIAVLFSTVSALPFVPAMSVFTAASAAVYLAAVSLLGGVRRDWRDWPMLLVLALAWPTFVVTLRYGQISTLTLALSALAVVAIARARPLAAGIALGLLVYKPNLLLVPVIVLVMMRQWRVLLGIAVGALAELAVGVAVAGLDGMAEYASILATLGLRPESVQIYPAESHSLRGFVRVLLPWPPLVTAATAAAVPASAWLAVRVWKRTSDWRVRVAALASAALLGSPHLLTYDLLLAAIPLILVADYLIERIGGITPVAMRWALGLVYFGAWPGTFIARLLEVQCSTIGLAWLLWQLGSPPADQA